MRRLGSALVAALALAALLVGPVAANALGPCNDGTGRGYAQHHVVELAHAQMLGSGEHTPGSHRGFSLCLNVHG